MPTALARDPNRPPNLDIAPSTRSSIKLKLGAAISNALEEEDEDASQDISQFGIAGRTWEAAYALRLFLTPSSPPPAPPSLRFSPPCPLFDTSTLPPRTIVEVGSGTGFVSLCLAPHLASGDTLVLTDLGEVCPLLEKNLGEAEARWKRKGVKSEAKVLVRPLPWGDMGALEKLRSEDLRPDVVLASDLVYFPELYGMLLRTLIGLCDEEKKPTLLFSYKTRSLVRETPFWSTFGRWFEFEAVFVAPPPPPQTSQADLAPPPEEWERFGLGEDEIFVFVCHRRPSTYGWIVPDDDEELMRGSVGADAADDQFERLLLGALEWN